MIVSDVVTRVLRKFGDEASVQITQEDIMRFINDGQKEIAYKNELLQTKGTLSVVAGTAEYTFPTDVLSIRTMYYDKSRIQMVELTEYDEYVNKFDPKTVDTGIPLIYTRWGSTFKLYPVPSADLVNGLELLYTRRPVEVTTLTDALSLPLEYHSVLVDYCMQEAYETDENFDAMTIKSQQVQQGMDELKGQETWKDREYYPTITVLPEDM